MTENPFDAPDAVEPAPSAVGVLTGDREDLRKVAKYQKGILLCILAYLGAVASIFLMPKVVPFEMLWLVVPLLGLAILGIAVTGAVFVFLLSIKVYGVGLGVFWGVLSLIPPIAIFALFAVNQKATGVLKQNGIKVGFLGANISSN